MSPDPTIGGKLGAARIRAAVDSSFGVAPSARDLDKATRLSHMSLAMLAGRDTATPSSKDPIEGSSR
jgi:hypothetical protein